MEPTGLFTSLARLPVRLLIGMVRGYRFFLSPWLGSACRFEPTCSAYSLQSLERHGALTGSYLTVCRLARCGPWCAGGFDPVPGGATPGARTVRIAGLFTGLAGSPASTAVSTPISPTDKTAP